MRTLVLVATAVFAVGCTGGSSDQSAAANDPKIQHLKDQVEREKGITADIKRRQEAESNR
jgi:hypothetical protein